MAKKMATNMPLLSSSALRVLGHPQLTGRAGRELDVFLTRVRNLVSSEIAPKALELDRIGYEAPKSIAWDIVRKGGKIGLLNLVAPRLAGGDTSLVCLRAALTCEELAAGDAGMATLVGAHGLGIVPLLVGGPGFWEGPLREIVESAHTEEPLLMSFAITEPAAGSDVEHDEYVRRAKLNCHATKVPGGYRLNGIKHFISNGSAARWLTVYMPVDRTDPYGSTCVFLVDAKSEGFEVTGVEHKMGHRSSPAAQISFDNVFVPDRLVVGRFGEGVASTAITLAASRPVVGAIATGIARGAYDRLVTWLREDPQGQQFAKRQEVQLEVVRMWEEIHGSRQLYLDAATNFDHVVVGAVFGNPLLRSLHLLPRPVRASAPVQWFFGSRLVRWLVSLIIRNLLGDKNLSHALAMSSAAKACGGDLAVSVCTRALVLAGVDCGDLRPELEKCFRDAKLTQIYEGTNQLNRIEAFAGLIAGHEMSMLADARSNKAPTRQEG